MVGVSADFPVYGYHGVLKRQEVGKNRQTGGACFGYELPGEGEKAAAERRAAPVCQAACCMEYSAGKGEAVDGCGSCFFCGYIV